LHSVSGDTKRRKALVEAGVDLEVLGAGGVMELGMRFGKDADLMDGLADDAEAHIRRKAFQERQRALFLQSNDSNDSNLSANQRRFLASLHKAASAGADGESMTSAGLRKKVEDRASGMDLLLGFNMRKEMGKFAPFLIPPDIISLEHKPFAKNAGGEIVKGKFMGSTIAAKTIFSSLTDSDADSFFHEVDVLTSLAHPNIVHLHGISVTGTGKALNMVMDYCGGGDLRHFLTDAQFTLSEFNRVTYEILSGVKYLHDKGVAHRDLKPENVLLLTGSHTIKITDFGLSKARTDVLSKGAGTAAYMAPESFLRETAAEKKKSDSQRNSYGIAQ
jgi:hypothetical protein